MAAAGTAAVALVVGGMCVSGKLTPMVAQYKAIKEKHKDDILFFRLGDFYEMFGDDALIASRILDITLTSREFGKGERIPMCGVPYHAAEGYIATLVAKGYRVAVCDQLEDPREAKGVVHRDVVRIVTPGTVTLPQALEAKSHRLLAALCRHGRGWGLAALDASTGEFWATQIEGPRALMTLREELIRLQPAELLLGPGAAPGEPGRDGADGADVGLMPAGQGGPVTREYDARAFHLDNARRTLLRHFGLESLHAFGIDHRPAAIRAAGAALQYLADTQRTSLPHVTRLISYEAADHMGLDETTRRNLELTARLVDGRVEGSLLSVLDRTMTGMGGRLLRTWVTQPLVRPDGIQARLNAVDHLVRRPRLREQVRTMLGNMFDIDRLLGRVATGSANARDLQALARSLLQVPPLQQLLEASLQEEGSQGQGGGRLAALASALRDVPDVAERILDALADDLPVSVREGGLIRDGYDDEVDRLRDVRRGGQRWIAALEEKERERTGIRSLKVGYNKVFGYYIEVTRPNLDRVPPDYERRQTLRHAERFITPELKEQEALVMGAADRLVAREYELFTQLRTRVAEQIPRLQPISRAVAELDALASLAEAAVEHRYVKPVVTEEGDAIVIREGRHPVVEVTHRERGFVANDTHLSHDGTRLMILTGPNMAGKSTYLRQVALIVLMAQMGSFVPAAEARIGLVDRIFTRIGAGDDLGSGRSTFMVEMNETAHILLHATPRSLVLLDELGRGTSTYDGMALAQAVAEHLHDVTQAKTILSTHYHELTRLDQALPHAANFHAAVKEEKGGVSFLYRIVPGSADRSYGINVARMAGVPEPVLRRARRLLRELETRALNVLRNQPPGQLTLWEPDDFAGAGRDGDVGGAGEAAAAWESAAGQPFVDGASLYASDQRAGEAEGDEERTRVIQDLAAELEGLSLNDMTPLEALNWLHRWQRKLGGEG